jgi:hypothetical protein
MDRSKNTELNEKLEALATEAKAKFALARKGSWEALLNHKAVGCILLQAKELRPKGYLKWAKESLNIGKAWCANLTFLAGNWHEFEQAHSWAESKGEIVGHKGYGVEKAVALIKRYRKAMDPASKEAGEAPKRASKVRALEEEVENLQRQRDNLLLLNGQLMAKLGSAAWKRPEPLDEAVKALAEKVSRLWRAGSTQGERESAEMRLKEMAQKRGWEFENFLSACRIERPVDWTSAEAA